MNADAGSYPSISVVIPTFNRPDDLTQCLRSLTSVTYGPWEVIVVDQSDDRLSEEVAQGAMRALPAIRYVHVSWKNASNARNVGLQSTTGDIVAFLDDDCTVVSDWLERVADVFVRYPEADMVFSSVLAPPHDPTRCVIPGWDACVEHVRQGRRAFLSTGGMSASMYLRRTSVQRLGLFDTRLGPGTAPFRAAEDRDYIYRLLALGGRVVASPSIVVWHHGRRDYAGGAAMRLYRDYVFSNGGHHMRILRQGDAFGLRIAAHYARMYLSDRHLRQVLVYSLSPHSRTVQFILQRVSRLSNLFWLGLYLWGGLVAAGLPSAGRSVGNRLNQGQEWQS